MQFIISLFCVALSVATLAVGAVGNPPAPQSRVLGTIVEAGHGSMVISAQGRYLATSDLSTRIWDAHSGRRIADVSGIGVGTPPSSIALLDDPCVGIATRDAPFRPAYPHAAADLVLFSCKGEKLTSLAVDHHVFGPIQAAAAVPTCGLFVVRYVNAVVVVDAAKRQIVPALGAMFPPQIALIAPAWRSCVVYAGQDGTTGSDAGRILQIDLERRSVLDVAPSGMNAEERISYNSSPVAAVSPDDTRLAILVRHMTGSGRTLRGADRIDVIDIAGKRLVRTFPVSRTAGHKIDAVAVLDTDRALVMSWGRTRHAVELLNFSDGSVSRATGVSELYDAPVRMSFAPGPRWLALGDLRTISIIKLGT